jgi:hypothetical protein
VHGARHSSRPHRRCREAPNRVSALRPTSAVIDSRRFAPRAIPAWAPVDHPGLAIVG